MDHASADDQWRLLEEREIKGAEARRRAAVAAVDTALRSKSPPVVTPARCAAAVASAPMPAPPAREHPSGEALYRGIYDLVASDSSELGCAALSALKSVEMARRFTALSFFAMPGFRGRYGFDGRPARGVAGHALLLTAAALLASWMLRVSLFSGLPLLMLSAGCILVLERLISMLMVTPILARKAALIIKDGRLTIQYGWFSTQQLSCELHWISDVGWSQSVLQKRLGQATLWITLTSASRGTQRRALPSPVRVQELPPLVDRLQSVVLTLRQASYAPSASGEKGHAVGF